MDISFLKFKKFKQKSLYQNFYLKTISNFFYSHFLDGNGIGDVCCQAPVGGQCAISSLQCGPDAQRIPSTDGSPNGCLASPEFADGYSAAFEVTGVPATLFLTRDGN